MNQYYQLHQIIQDIQSIIESNTINDEQKVIKIREIYNELKMKELDELRKILDIDAFKLIQQYINECRSGIKKILLDIIELVTEKGVQRNNPWDPPDPIFNNIQNSGLLNKIELMIKDKIKIEKKQKKHSVEAEQLIRIHFQILSGTEFDQQMIDISAQVIEKNIKNLLKKIKKLKQKENKGNKNKQGNEETEREIKQSQLLIKIIPLIRGQDPRFRNEINIPEQVIKLVKEKICPLIHLNCPPDINCQQCMNIPQIPALIELKSAVFQSLSGVSKINYEFEDILVNDHNIIPHLIHTLIQQASQPQFKKETDSQEQQNNQQQSESSSSISLVNQSQFLERIISNNSNISKVIKTPNALHSLCTLTCYKINIHFSQEIDKQTFKVRHSNRHCLWDIQRYGDASVQTELVNARYARVLVIAISTASGAGEEQDREICDGLDSISKFFKLLRQGRKIYLPSFPPQPLLARIFDEQIEEEGAIEEIESQMVNKGYRGDTKNNASIAKGEILNYFIEQGNQRPYWYNW